MEEIEKLQIQEEQAAMARQQKLKELKTKMVMGQKQLTQYMSPTYKRFSTSKKKFNMDKNYMDQ